MHSFTVLPNDVEKNGMGILGMGVSGAAVLRWLVRKYPALGIRVPLVLRDKNPALSCPSFLAQRPLTVCRFGERWLENIEEKVLFRSPVIRPDLPALGKAVRQGTILTSEMALTDSLCPAVRFTVTGSDGKTSTVSMLHKILTAVGEKEGFSAFLGGNIGTPLLEQVEQMMPKDRAVFELSSFQLMDCFPKSRVATVLNLTQNHLDVHTSFEEYIDAKTHIFTNAEKKVIQAECPYTLEFMEKGDIICTHTHTAEEVRRTFGNHPTVWLSGDQVCYTEGNATEYLFSRADLQVAGTYQLYNAMTAAAMLYPFVSSSDIRTGLSRFHGVPHRLQKVATLGDVVCYDSAIDTTPARVHATLSSFSGKPTVICGGSDKGLDYLPLAKTLLTHAGRVVVTGDTAKAISEALEHLFATEGKAIPVYREKRFADGVKKAVEITPKGEALVLSPGCASFDEFANYKAKSASFSDILKSLGAKPIS